MGTKLKSLKDISVGLRSGELTAESLVQSCMANYERLEPALHAYKSWDDGAVLKNAGVARCRNRIRHGLSPGVKRTCRRGGLSNA